MTVWNRFGVLNTLEGTADLWDVFKYETPEAAKDCIGECPRSWCGIATMETVGNIEDSRAAILAGNHGWYRAQIQKAIYNFQTVYGTETATYHFQMSWLEWKPGPRTTPPQEVVYYQRSSANYSCCI